MTTLTQEQTTPAQALPCPDRQEAASRLGAERRRLFFVATGISLVAPLLPYLTGTWETIWYALAATPLPLPVRAAVFLIVFHLALAVVLLPVSFYAGYTLPHAFGLSRQTPRAWWADWTKATLLSLALGLLVGGVFLWCVAAGGASWWWLFALFGSAGTLLLVFLMPYVLLPLFFKMRPLADEAAVERIHALVRRAGTEVREVCTLDFSRRTAEANAAVIGLGRSRRVVLADTLLQEFTPEEIDAVVAHELGHHVHRDVQRLLLVSLALLWLGLGLAAWLAPLALPILSLPSLSYVPGYPVLFCVAELYALLISPLTNSWSRRVEADADRFALRTTGQPSAFASAMLRLSCQNLVEIRPPRWAEVLLASHPALHRRIRLAESWSS